MNQPFHITTISPWPLINSMNIFSLLTSTILFFNLNNLLFLMFMIMTLSISAFQWWRDMIRETLFQGTITKFSYSNLKYAMMLFICSEIMFFISFFWTYLNTMLNQSIELGSYWPPMNIMMMDPMNIPLLNSIILISSSSTLTWTHHSLINQIHSKSILSIIITMSLAFTFTYLQIFEYMKSSFSMNDSIYGSIFFLTTGFHGMHVLIGSIFISINFIRLANNQFSKLMHFGMESSIWYWHFVDVIWLILFIMIYL